MHFLPIDEIGDTSILAYYPLDTADHIGLVIGEEWDRTISSIVKTVALVSHERDSLGWDVYSLTTLSTHRDLDEARGAFLAACIDRSVAPVWA